MIGGGYILDMKVCTACHINRDESLFMIDKRYKDKLFPTCLLCLPQTKTCTTCLKSLSKLLFNKEKRSSDGLTSRCKECHSLTGKKYRDTNPDILKEQKKKYVSLNKDKIKAGRQKHYQNNKDAINKKSSVYQKANPQIRKRATRNYYLKNKLYYKLKCQERNARKQKLTIQKFSVEDFNKRMSVFGNKCFYCGGAFEHVDHAIPLIRNGYHCLANLRPACMSCNLRKGTKTSIEFLQG